MDQVNVKATFRDDDVFERKQYAAIAMDLVSHHPPDRGACSIAIDAPWGIGKTTFVHMWINELDLGNPNFISAQEMNPPYESMFAGKNVLPIYYNAWENDFSDHALAPLLFALCAQMEKRNQKGLFLVDQSEKVIDFISACAQFFTSLTLNHITKKQTVADVGGTAVGLATKGFLQSLNGYLNRKSQIEPENTISAEYDKQMLIRKRFRDALEELATISDGVYIFIDELDRCKPSFAIETLEIIKHFFNIPHVTFIFSVDQLQLCHAIAGRYGNELDAGGYFSKFVDHHLMLPKPTARQMIRMVNASVRLSAMQEEDYEKIFHACDITPREIPRIFAANDTLLNQVDTFGWDTSERMILSTILLLFLCMKHRKPDVYAAYMSGKGDWDYYGWQSGYPKLYSFLSKFGHYRTLLSDQCAKDWTPLTAQRVSSSDDYYGVNYRVAFFGLTVISTKRGIDKKSLIHILHEWLETIGI